MLAALVASNKKRRTKNNMANTNKIIYTRRIAMKLIEMGHIAAGTMPNPSKPEFLCWIFNVTPKFERDLQTILDERKAARGIRATTGVLDEAPQLPAN